MSAWFFKEDFPNILYKKINNIAEYIDSICELKNSIKVTINLYGEVYDTEIFPFYGDLSLWEDYFIKTEYKGSPSVLEDMLSKKPNKDEFPILMTFASNYNYLYWIPLKEIK